MQNEFFKRFLSSIILFPITFFIIFKNSYFFNLFIILLFLTSSYEWYHMTRKKYYQSIGFIFLLISFSSAFFLRNIFSDNEGLFYFLLVFLTCILSDIGGYIFGKIFKGPKLIKISPKKTISGSFGSYLLSIFFFYFVFQIHSIATFKEENYNLDFNIYFIIILLCTVSQIGDLIISFFKRISNINDTGKIIPGHGGILDRIDGMIFAIPSFYLLLCVYNFF